MDNISTINNTIFCGFLQAESVGIPGRKRGPEIVNILCYALQLPENRGKLSQLIYPYLRRKEEYYGKM